MLPTTYDYSYDSTGSDDLTAGGAIALTVLGLVYVAVLVFGIYLYMRIAKKAGWTYWHGLLVLVPLANVVFIVMFAFMEWPIERRLREAEARLGIAPGGDPYAGHGGYAAPGYAPAGYAGYAAPTGYAAPGVGTAPADGAANPYAAPGEGTPPAPGVPTAPAAPGAPMAEASPYGAAPAASVPAPEPPAGYGAGGFGTPGYGTGGFGTPGYGTGGFGTPGYDTTPDAPASPDAGDTPRDTTPDDDGTPPASPWSPPASR